MDVALDSRAAPDRTDPAVALAQTFALHYTTDATEAWHRGERFLPYETVSADAVVGRPPLS